MTPSIPEPARLHPALSDSERRYRTLFDSIDEGFCIIQMIFDAGGKPVDYRFLEINPAFERHTGLHDAQGRRMREIAPAHEDHWFEIYGRIARTGEPLRFQNRAEQLQRTYDVYAFRFGEASQLQVAILFTDISERLRVQTELDRFFSLSLDLLCIAGTEGYFKRVSPAVTDVLGWSVEEFLARPFIDFVHPEDREATRHEVDRQLVAGASVLQFENRYLHRDGSWRVLSWRSVPAGDAMYASARDVTELRRMEAALRRTNAELEQRVQQRTVELQESNLALQRSNEELRDFAFVASHDLQEPLRKIQTFGDRLMARGGSTLDDTGRDFLQRMVSAAARLRRLISDLLTLSRVTSIATAREAVSLDQVVGNVVCDLEILLERTGGRVEVGPLPTIRAHPTQMEQLFLNLISNALKFRRPELPPVVTIRGELLDECARISVQDNGIGFDEQYADRIFQVFQRLVARDAFEGSGIGLAVCRRIVEQHGGTIGASSSPGIGSTFTVTLPVLSQRPGS